MACAGCIIELSPGSAPRLSATNTPATGDAGEYASAAVGGPSKAAEPEPEPVGEWVNATGNLAGMESECGDLSGLSAKPDEDLLIAGVAARGLFASEDGGESWKALGQGHGSDKIPHRPISFVYDPDDTKIWWETGIYGLGVFQTKDNGGAFKRAGDIFGVETLAVDFSDPERQLLVAAGHEVARIAWRSNNGGNTWTEIGQSLPEAIACQNIVLLDPKTYLIGCDYSGEAIYRTTDAGEYWEMVSAEGGARSPLHASDGSYYWARPGGGLVRSIDQGVTWTSVTANGMFKGLAPIELPDGRLAMLGGMGVVVSSDHGASWKRVTGKLPYDDPTGFIYSTHRHAFYIKHFQCLQTMDTVLPDAIMRFVVDL